MGNEVSLPILIEHKIFTALENKYINKNPEQNKK